MISVGKVSTLAVVASNNMIHDTLALHLRATSTTSTVDCSTRNTSKEIGTLAERRQVYKKLQYSQKELQYNQKEIASKAKEYFSMMDKYRFSILEKFWSSSLNYILLDYGKKINENVNKGIDGDDNIDYFRDLQQLINYFDLTPNALWKMHFLVTETSCLTDHQDPRESFDPKCRNLHKALFEDDRGFAEQLLKYSYQKQYAGPNLEDYNEPKFDLYLTRTDLHEQRFAFAAQHAVWWTHFGVTIAEPVEDGIQVKQGDEITRSHPRFQEIWMNGGEMEADFNEGSWVQANDHPFWRKRDFKAPASKVYRLNGNDQKISLQHFLRTLWSIIKSGDWWKKSYKLVQRNCQHFVLAFVKILEKIVKKQKNENVIDVSVVKRHMAKAALSNLKAVNQAVEFYVTENQKNEQGKTDNINKLLNLFIDVNNINNANKIILISTNNAAAAAKAADKKWRKKTWEEINSVSYIKQNADKVKELKGKICKYICVFVVFLGACLCFFCVFFRQSQQNGDNTIAAVGCWGCGILLVLIFVLLLATVGAGKGWFCARCCGWM